MKHNIEIEPKHIPTLRLLIIVFSIFGGFLIALFISPYWNMPIHQHQNSSLDAAAIEEELKGNYTGAISCYEKALSKEKDGQKKCLFQRAIGDLYLKIYDKKTALEYYNNASEIAETNNYKECLSDVMLSKWRFFGNPEYLMNASKIAEELNDKKRMFYSYSYQANYYFTVENYEKAMEYYKKAIELKENGDNRTLGYDYAGIGALYSLSNDSVNAIKNFIISEKLLEESRDKEALIDLYLRWGFVYMQSNNIKNAETYYYKAMTISQELNKSTDNISLKFAEIYSSEAYRNLKEGNYEAAVSSAEKCAEIYSKTDPVKVSTCNIVKCYAYFYLEDYENALNCYENIDMDVLSDKEKFNAYLSSASLYSYLAQTYRGRQIEVKIIDGKPVQFDKSLEWFDKAIDTYKKAMDLGEKINMNVSNISEKILNITKAKEEYEKNK